MACHRIDGSESRSQTVTESVTESVTDSLQSRALPNQPSPAPTVTPAASAAVVKSTKPGTDAFTYFVQVGAYARPEDAEQQRARVGLMGLSAKVTEREQSGRTVYRVRLGPFERKDDADAAQQRLAGNGVEAALVRVER